ncbi:MAG: heptosyltransferase-2 [Gammaproteobacteria bacterium]|jgi:heptosyltransferase-2
MTTSDSILVVGPSWIGDMVMAQSLLKIIRQAQPQVSIDVLTPKWSLGILARMPEVREGIALDVKHGELGFRTRYQTGKSLRAKKYKQAYILPKTLKSALTPYFANIPIRTGFFGEMRYGLINDIKPLDKTVLDQTVKKYASLAQPSNQIVATPFPALEPNRDNAQNLMRTHQINQQGLLVAFMPGAEYGPAKQWPVTHFAELAQMINKLGGQVLIFGSDKDRTDGDTIAESNPNVINLCGKTSIEDAVDLIAATHVAVTNDSGLMHVAASVGIPLVSIYGSSSPLYTPPLTDKAIVEWLKLDCSPCYQRECPLQHLNCLKQITPQSIFHHIETINVAIER